MNINDLTLGQVMLPIASFFSQQNLSGLDNGLIGEKVIIRTYSAGVHFGLLKEKSGDEVILENARRMYGWWAKESISLSAVSIHGVKPEKSKICEPVTKIWLQAIEIIPCTEQAIESIEGCENVKAE